MLKKTDKNTSQVPWLSLIVKKRRSRKISVKNSSASTSNPSLSPLLSTWWIFHKIERRCRRIPLSVPTRPFKSQVMGYHEIAANLIPGDIVISTAEEMQHPAYIMKESIGAKYIFLVRINTSRI